MSIGHGNLVEAKPKWQITGKMIAAAQRQVLVVRVLFFSDLVIGCVRVGVGWWPSFHGWRLKRGS